MNAAARSAVGCLSSRVARKRVSRAAGLRHYETEIKTRKGHCRAPGCQSRLGVVRVTIDTTAKDAIERFAHVECAQCERVWYRVSSDTPVTRQGYQAARLTLIAPSGEARRLYTIKSGGAIHVASDDTLTLRDAPLGAVTDGVAAWQAAWNRREVAKGRSRDRKAALEAAALEASRELRARLALRDEERRAEEAAASERERKGLA